MSVSEGVKFVQWEVPYAPKALNDHVACEPFESDAIQATDGKSGFKIAKQKAVLAALKVVVGNDKIYTGSTVYVRGDWCYTPEARAVWEFKGTKVIFVPMSEIKIAEKEHDDSKWRERI